MEGSGPNRFVSAGGEGIGEGGGRGGGGREVCLCAQWGREGSHSNRKSNHDT